MTDTATAPAPPAPKVPAPRVSGFCQTEGHALCAGAVADASPLIVKPDEKKPEVRLDTRTVACPCTCHDGQPPQCLRCRYRNANRPAEVDAVTRRCLDVEACLDRCASRQAANPTHLLLVEVVRDAEHNRADNRAQRRRETMTEAQAQATDGKTTTERTPRVPRVKVGACHHCGTPTKGGKFAPGHDAQLKGELQKLAENTEARKSARVDAAAEIVARGWDARKGIPDDIAADATAYVDKHGAEKVVQSSAERRKNRHTEQAG